MFLQLGELGCWLSAAPAPELLRAPPSTTAGVKTPVEACREAAVVFSAAEECACGSLGKCQSGGAGRGRGFGGSAGTPGQQRGGGVTLRAEPAAPSGTVLLPAVVVGVPALVPAVAPRGCEGRAGMVSERETGPVRFTYKDCP